MTADQSFSHAVWWSYEAHAARQAQAGVAPQRTWPADVNVEEAHVEALRRKRKRELRRERALAYAAFAREDEDDVLELGHALVDELLVGVGAFRSGGARRLVRAARARVGGARLIAGCAGAVCNVLMW